MKPIPQMREENPAQHIDLMRSRSPSHSPKPAKSNIEVQDIFQLMEHNQVIARRMQDLQKIIADQKRNIDELPHIHEKNCAYHNHSHRQQQNKPQTQTQKKSLIHQNRTITHAQNHVRSKSKMEIYQNSLYQTSRNEYAKKRNEQLTKDYGETLESQKE